MGLRFSFYTLLSHTYVSKQQFQFSLFYRAKYTINVQRAQTVINCVSEAKARKRYFLGKPRFPQTSICPQKFALFFPQKWGWVGSRAVWKFDKNSSISTLSNFITAPMVICNVMISTSTVVV